MVGNYIEHEDPDSLFLASLLMSGIIFVAVILNIFIDLRCLFVSLIQYLFLFICMSESICTHK